MLGIIVGFLTSFVVSGVLVFISPRLGVLFFDHDTNGIQKFHAAPVPRVGGVGIFLAFAACTASAAWTNVGVEEILLWLICCSLLAFGSGVAEDITKKVSPRVRLSCAMLASLLACFVLGAILRRLDIRIMDQMLTVTPFAIAFTVFAVTGVVNSVNLIDGFNGLAPMVSASIFASVAFVAHQVGDSVVLTIALAMIGGILGFTVWNFPGGTIFLGDGGAYFIGFMLAEAIVLLVIRNPFVSAFYGFVVALYPIFETIFSIYRRKFVRGTAPGAPDGVHLHTLIYRRVMRIGAGSNDRDVIVRRNSLTSPYLWCLNLFAIVPATLFWGERGMLLISIVVFATLYIALYRAIVTFRTPTWLIARSKTLVLAENLAPVDASSRGEVCGNASGSDCTTER